MVNFEIVFAFWVALFKNKINFLYHDTYHLDTYPPMSLLIIDKIELTFGFKIV